MLYSIYAACIKNLISTTTVHTVNDIHIKTPQETLYLWPL